MHLPDEILLMIGGHIDPFAKKPNSFKLLLVCRHWYHLFTPQLYSDIFIDDDRLPALVRSLHENPTLSPYIREFGVRWWRSFDDKEGDYDDELLHALAEKASHSPEEAEKWKNSLKKTNTDAWLAALLMYLPNMNILNIDHSGYSDYVKRTLCRAAYREKPFDSIPGLQNLETVQILNEDRSKTTYEACEIIPFFHLPKVRSLHGDTVIENEYNEREDHPAQKPAKGTSPIQKIKLEQSNARKGFTEFITSCASLQEFEYGHTNQENWGESFLAFRPGLLYKALLTQKHSLQVLRIDEGGEHDPDDEDEDDDVDSHPDDWFGPLKEFVHLRELHVRIRNLFDYGRENKTPLLSLRELIPNTLEELVLGDYDASQHSLVKGNLLDLLSRRDEFPNLRKIQIQLSEAVKIDCPNAVYWWDLYQAPTRTRVSFEEIERRCGELGVEFGYCYGGLISILQS